MPFKSKAQQKYMFAAEGRGDLPKGTAKRWAHHTKNIKKLPEHKQKRAAAFGVLFGKLAADLSGSAVKLPTTPLILPSEK